MSIIDFAKRSYRFVKRHINPPIDDFPIDAWTDASYASWFDRHTASSEELDYQRGHAEDFPYKPVFSFIVPLYKTPLDYLRVMADSVLGQTYSHLQLILVNSSPELPDLVAEVERYREADSRVTVVSLEENLGITENTNRGIDVATGDFCCFLDHDDYIDANLLFEYVAALNEDPEIDVLYCDEDLVRFDEKRRQFIHQNPFIKPAFSPELLLCRNYIVHLMTIRRSIIEAMPTPDARYDGSQDYNMVLYASHAARKVHGVQKVLYHWRISDTSTATNPDSKPYSLRSCRLAIAGQLARREIDASIIGTGLYLVHNEWFTKDPSRTVSVVVDCSSTSEYADRFVEAFQQGSSLDFSQLVLVDYPGDRHLSIGCDVSYVDTDPMASTGARFNAGARDATGEYLVFLDAGCILTTPEPLEQLVQMCAVQGVGISSPKVLYRNGKNKALGVAVTAERIMPMYRGYDDDFPGYQCNLRTFQNVSAVGFQGLTVPRSLFKEVGMFDERFEGEAGAVDLCIRIREAGHRLVAMPTVKLEVAETCPDKCFDCETNAPDYIESDLVLFDEKHPGLRMNGDPYLNRNLDQASSYCQIPKELID